MCWIRAIITIALSRLNKKHFQTDHGKTQFFFALRIMKLSSNRAVLSSALQFTLDIPDWEQFQDWHQLRRRDRKYFNFCFFV